MSQDLTCTFTNGSGTKTSPRRRDGTREGTRIGTRDGARDRDGTRTGTQTGVQTGSLAYDLDVEARKSNQYTGFILKGWKVTPSYTETGAPSGTPGSATPATTSATTLRRLHFGDYTFGDTFEPVTGTEWGEWDALRARTRTTASAARTPTTSPRSATSSPPGAITDGAITDGAITDGDTDGAITDGAITDGAIAYGAITTAR